MIRRSDDRVWIAEPNTTSYYLLGEGITELHETCKTALLETPHIDTAVCTREILYHTAQIEFEGYRTRDTAMRILRSKYLKRGKDALITLVIGNLHDAGTTALQARRVKGYVCLENPGTGEGVMGSRVKGKIVYASEPEEGIFNEDTKEFIVL